MGTTQQQGVADDNDSSLKATAVDFGTLLTIAKCTLVSEYLSSWGGLLDTLREKWVPVATACSIVGVGRRHFYDWVKRDLLDDPATLLSRLDVVELTIIHALSTSLGAAEGRQAYRQIRDRVKATIPPGRLEVLWETRGHAASVVTSDADLGATIREVDSKRPFQLVRPYPEVEQNLARLDRDYQDRKSGLPPNPVRSRSKHRTAG
jgi:hypothetical protein